MIESFHWPKLVKCHADLTFAALLWADLENGIVHKVLYIRFVILSHHPLLVLALLFRGLKALDPEVEEEGLC